MTLLERLPYCGHCGEEYDNKAEPGGPTITFWCGLCGWTTLLDATLKIFSCAAPAPPEPDYCQCPPDNCTDDPRFAHQRKAVKTP